MHPVPLCKQDAEGQVFIRVRAVVAKLAAVGLEFGVALDDHQRRLLFGLVEIERHAGGKAQHADVHHHGAAVAVQLDQAVIAVEQFVTVKHHGFFIRPLLCFLI